MTERTRIARVFSRQMRFASLNTSYAADQLWHVGWPRRHCVWVPKEQEVLQIRHDYCGWPLTAHTISIYPLVAARPGRGHVRATHYYALYDNGQSVNYEALSRRRPYGCNPLVFHPFFPPNLCKSTRGSLHRFLQSGTPAMLEMAVFQPSKDCECLSSYIAERQSRIGRHGPDSISRMLLAAFCFFGTTTH